MQLTFLDLFSGIGGFRYALEKLGHKCIGFSEIDKYAIQTYKANFDTSDDIELGDIRNIASNDLPDFDLLTAGFPCQSFSISGKRLGFNDVRGTLFFEIARLLKYKQPRYFILENVKGLINHDKPARNEEWSKLGYPSISNTLYDGRKKGIGRTLKIIEETLDECGYYFKWKVLNTKDYGLPQNRERIIIVGQRKDLGPFNYQFPEEEPLSLCVRELLEAEVDRKFFLSEAAQDRIIRHLY